MAFKLAGQVEEVFQSILLNSTFAYWGRKKAEAAKRLSRTDKLPCRLNLFFNIPQEFFILLCGRHFGKSINSNFDYLV